MLRVIDIFHRHLAAFRKYTPFGVLLEDDMKCAIKATARDSGFTVADVLKELNDAA